MYYVIRPTSIFGNVFQRSGFRVLFVLCSVEIKFDGDVILDVDVFVGRREEGDGRLTTGTVQVQVVLGDHALPDLEYTNLG